MVSKGYLKVGDLNKLLSAPGAPLTATMAGAPPVVTLAGTSALKVYNVKDSDPATAIFAESSNYVYGNAILAGASPYGTKGFIIMRKGGDAAVFKSTQAAITDWPTPREFQSAVGLKTGDAEGTPSAGEAAGLVLTFP